MQLASGSRSWGREPTGRVPGAGAAGRSGQWRKVLDLTDECTADFRLAGAYQVATARMTAAAAHLALGEAVDAEQLISRALPSLEAMRPSASLYLAEALIRQSRLGEA